MAKDSQKKKQNRPKNYKKLTKEDREKIYLMKQNVKNKEISKLYNLSEKTIESIKSPEIKNEYKEFKQDLVEKGLQMLINQSELKYQPEPKIKKRVKQYLKILVEKNQDYYNNLAPKSRQGSSRRRIFEQISLAIIEKMKEQQNNGLNLSESEVHFISPEHTQEECFYEEDFSGFCTNVQFDQDPELSSQLFLFNVKKCGLC